MWEKYTLKNGIVLSYNDGKHVYYVNEKRVPSVTGICSRGLVKPQLSDWLVNTPMYEFKKLINDKLDNNETLDRVNLENVNTDDTDDTNDTVNVAVCLENVKTENNNVPEYLTILSIFRIQHPSIYVLLLLFVSFHIFKEEGIKTQTI